MIGHGYSVQGTILVRLSVGASVGDVGEPHAPSEIVVTMARGRANRDLRRERDMDTSAGSWEGSFSPRRNAEHAPLAAHRAR